MPVPDFNIVPEIGGVDTSDPSRSFTCAEQLAVVAAAFGEGVSLPNSKGELSVRKRDPGEGYSSARGRIYVANDGLDRALMSETGRGFLFTATGAALSAGRLAFRGSLGSQVVVKKHKSAEFRERQGTLTAFLLDKGLSDEPGAVSVADEASANLEFSSAVRAFLDDLWLRDTVLAAEQYTGGPYMGPYERFTFDILGRLTKLRAIEV